MKPRRVPTTGIASALASLLQLGSRRLQIVFCRVEMRIEPHARFRTPARLPGTGPAAPAPYPDRCAVRRRPGGNRETRDSARPHLRACRPPPYRSPHSRNTSPRCCRAPASSGLSSSTCRNCAAACSHCCCSASALARLYRAFVYLRDSTAAPAQRCRRLPMRFPVESSAAPSVFSATGCSGCASTAARRSAMASAAFPRANSARPD